MTFRSSPQWGKWWACDFLKRNSYVCPTAYGVWLLVLLPHYIITNRGLWITFDEPELYWFIAWLDKTFPFGDNGLRAGLWQNNGCFTWIPFYFGSPLLWREQCLSVCPHNAGLLTDRWRMKWHSLAIPMWMGCVITDAWCKSRLRALVKFFAWFIFALEPLHSFKT